MRRETLTAGTRINGARYCKDLNVEQGLVRKAKTLIDRTPPPGEVFYLLCSLIKSRVYVISRRDATVASRREI